MYDNGYIVKCRSILTNDICLSEASHKADVFLVCISYLTYSLKKCINNLAVWKIRVNTHTHTHTHNYRASIYNKTFNLQWITGINYPGLSLSYDKSSYKYSSSAILSQKGRIFLWSDGTGERSLRPNIVGFLFPPITV